MNKTSVLLILAMLLVSNFHAAVSLPPWDWSKYTGTSHWSVATSEDDSGCDGGIVTEQYSISIEHSGTSATMGDVGHGPISGTMTGNILHIASRTVQDGSSGSSRLSSYDVTFTPDCLGFSSTYHWDYSDQYQSCSGSTTLIGTQVPGSCPAPTVVPVIPGDNPNVVTPSIESLRSEIAGARTDLKIDLALYGAIDADTAAIKDYERRAKENDDPHQFDSLTAPIYQDLHDKQVQAKSLEPAIEAKYQVILDKDPKNFWANWDMAELKKNQGKYDDFSAYFDSAATNKNILAGTSDQLKTNVAHDLGISYLPTVQNSNVVRIIHDEDGRWTGGMIYDLNVPKPKSDSMNIFGLKLSALFSNKMYELVVGTVGEPGG